MWACMPFAPKGYLSNRLRIPFGFDQHRNAIYCVCTGADRWLPKLRLTRRNWLSSCRIHHVRRLEVFGSAAGLEFDSGRSDFDFLVEFETLPPGSYATNFFDLKEALELLLGRPVDLVVLSAVRNPWFRKGIEQSKALLYAA